MELRKFDLNLLASLDALLEERSVTRAAKRVGVGQPAMSGALAKLRELLGDPLLVRTSAGMTLTGRAEELRAPLRAALDGLERALQPAAAFDPGRADRTFTVTVPDSTEAIVMPRLAARLAEVAPKVRIAVQGVGEKAAREALESGGVDLAIGYFPEPPPHLYRQPLFTERLVAVVRKGHALASRALDLETYAAHAQVLVAPKGRKTGRMDRVLAEHGLERTIAYATPHFAAAALVVAETDLLGTLPEQFARACAKWLPLHVIELPIDLGTTSIVQIWHERTHADPAHRWLRSMFASSSGAVMDRIGERYST